MYSQTQTQSEIAIESRTLFELFGLSDEKIRNVTFPVNVNVNPGSLVPPKNSTYQFCADHVRRMLLWIGGIAGRNLMITGPTGSGKSSLVEQLCAQLGRELYRVPCHGRMEFSELTGQLTVKTDGSTEFVHGPLPRAMLSGSVLLLDELNFIHPSIVGGLNTVLDGGSLLLPETGELITPHDDFRIVATGNALDHGDDSSLYRGTQRMNLALIQRFLTLKVDYILPIDEAAMLHRVAPLLPGIVIEIMVNVAADVRDAFKRGDMESTLSTRTVVKWAKILQSRVSVLTSSPEEELNFSLKFVLTDGLKPEDAKAIEGTLQRFASGLVIEPVNSCVNSKSNEPEPAHDKVATPTSSTALVTSTTKMHFLINPDRQGRGVIAFWVGVDPVQSLGISFHGTVSPRLSVKVVEGKDQKWLTQTRNSKRSRGYDKACTAQVDLNDAEEIVREVVDALRQVFSSQLQVRCRNLTAHHIFLEILKQLRSN